MHRIYKEEHPNTKDPMWLIAYGKDAEEDDLKAGLAAVSSFINANPFPAKGITFINAASKSIERTDVACSLMETLSVLPLIAGTLPKIKAISWNSLTSKYVLALDFSGNMLKAGAEYKYDGTGGFVGTNDIEDVRSLMNTYTGNENAPEVIEDAPEEAPAAVSGPEEIPEPEVDAAINALKTEAPGTEPVTEVDMTTVFVQDQAAEETTVPEPIAEVPPAGGTELVKEEVSEATTEPISEETSQIETSAESVAEVPVLETAEPVEELPAKEDPISVTEMPEEGGNKAQDAAAIGGGEITEEMENIEIADITKPEEDPLNNIPDLVTDSEEFDPEPDIDELLKNMKA